MSPRRQQSPGLERVGFRRLLGEGSDGALQEATLVVRHNITRRARQADVT